MSGINIANEKSICYELAKSARDNHEKVCVFISYKKDDIEFAEIISKYLMNSGINIYFDQRDEILQEAVSKENDQLIVDSIKRGLAVSSHLICLISDTTKLSWWVPYEIGFAEKDNVKIASVKLKGVEDIPSFLKINDVLNNVEEFIKYVQQISIYGNLFAEKKLIEVPKEDIDLLSSCLD